MNQQAEDAEGGHGAEHTRIQQGLRVSGAVVHLGLGIFPNSVSGLVMPPSGVIALYLGWLAGLAVIVRLWNRAPGVVAVMPVLGLVYWWGVVTFGGSLLGWQA